MCTGNDGMLQESRAHGKTKKEDLSCIVWFRTVSFFILLWVSYAWYQTGSVPPPKTVDNSEPHEFTEENAR